MSATQFNLIDEAIARRFGTDSAEHIGEVRAQYLEAILAAVLRETVQKGVCVLVDLTSAARQLNIIIEPLSVSHALVSWGGVDETEEDLSQRNPGI